MKTLHILFFMFLFTGIVRAKRFRVAVMMRQIVRPALTMPCARRRIPLMNRMMRTIHPTSQRILWVGKRNSSQQ